MQMKINQILFATTNIGKTAEVKSLARQFSIEVFGLNDVIARRGVAPEVEEVGLTYQENAVLKAEAYFAWSGMATLADDTGLEVQALSGRPGIHSARYAQSEASHLSNTELLLMRMQNHSARSAKFVCELVFILDNMNRFFARGELDGEIAGSSVGSGGFGYDNIFYLPRFGKTLAEAKEQAISVRTHREQALTRLFDQLY